MIDVPQISPNVWLQLGGWIHDAWPHIVDITRNIITWANVIAFPVGLFFLIGIIYSVEKLKVIKIKEKKKYDVKIEPAFEETTPQPSKDLAVRWQKVQQLLNSPNENDWKQAILEADTMLLDVLTGLGYQGDGVGEKLKRVQPGEFKNIQDAWEAHKVRNEIAHTPGYKLDHHVALKVIHHFRRVFEEFYYI